MRLQVCGGTRIVSSRLAGQGLRCGCHQALQCRHARSALGPAAQPLLQLLQALAIAAAAAGQHAQDGRLGHVQAGADLAASRLQRHRRGGVGPQQLAAEGLGRQLLLQQHFWLGVELLLLMLKLLWLMLLLLLLKMLLLLLLLLL